MCDQYTADMAKGVLVALSHLFTSRLWLWKTVCFYLSKTKRSLVKDGFWCWHVTHDFNAQLLHKSTSERRPLYAFASFGKRFKLTLTAIRPEIHASSFWNPIDVSKQTLGTLSLRDSVAVSRLLAVFNRRLSAWLSRQAITSQFLRLAGIIQCTCQPLSPYVSSVCQAAIRPSEIILKILPADVSFSRMILRRQSMSVGGVSVC